MPQPTQDEVLEAIKEEMAAIKIPGAESATLGSTWADLDVDSLDLVELVKAIEDRFDITIVDGELKEISGVGDAVALTQRLAAEKATA
jgi:acyl carrier protein